MATLADLFKTCYLTGGSGVEFSAVRLHYRGVDEICGAFGADALTVGSDIYFRQEAFAPHTREGLRLLAHEVAQEHLDAQCALLEQLGRVLAPRRRGTAAGRAPGRPDAAPARQRAGGDARGTERPARLPGPPGGDRERSGGVPASPDQVRPQPEHRGAAPGGGIRVPVRPAPPAAGLAEVPAAAPAGRDRRGPGGRRPGPGAADSRRGSCTPPPSGAMPGTSPRSRGTAGGRITSWRGT